MVGDVYRHWPGKTITEYDDHLFCMITMNHHPLHTNDWFAARVVQGRNVVVGNLVYSLVLGMSVPDVSGAAIANLEVETLQHKFPTFHGDTIHAETRVLDVKQSKSQARPRHRHRRDQGLQPGRQGGLLLPPQGDGVEARVAPDRARPYDGAGLGLTDGQSTPSRARVARERVHTVAVIAPATGCRPVRCCVGRAAAARPAVAARPATRGRSSSAR